MTKVSSFEYGMWQESKWAHRLIAWLNSMANPPPSCAFIRWLTPSCATSATRSPRRWLCSAAVCPMVFSTMAPTTPTLWLDDQPAPFDYLLLDVVLPDSASLDRYVETLSPL